MFWRKKEKRVTIRLKKRYSADETSDHMPYEEYDILYGRLIVGEIELTPAMNDYMYYYGHVGYHVYKPYRGHHFAKSACLLLLERALIDHNMTELIITCDPDNIASIKTIEGLPNVEFIERVDVPKDHPLYLKGEKEKLIYRVRS